MWHPALVACLVSATASCTIAGGMVSAMSYSQNSYVYRATGVAVTGNTHIYSLYHLLAMWLIRSTKHAVPTPSSSAETRTRLMWGIPSSKKPKIRASPYPRYKSTAADVAANLN